MSKEVKVSGVRIKVGDVDIEMSLKQAKELHEMLDDLFGKEVKIVRDTQWIPYYPPIYPSRPWYGWEITWDDTTTCGDLPNGGTVVCYSASTTNA